MIFPVISAEGRTSASALQSCGLHAKGKSPLATSILDDVSFAAVGSWEKLWFSFPSSYFVVFLSKQN